jgi:hypothetical protein
MEQGAAAAGAAEGGAAGGGVEQGVTADVGGGAGGDVKLPAGKSFRWVLVPAFATVAVASPRPSCVLLLPGLCCV